MILENDQKETKRKILCSCYETWEECRQAIKGKKIMKHKSFKEKDEAEAFITKFKKTTTEEVNNEDKNNGEEEKEEQPNHDNKVKLKKK